MELVTEPTPISRLQIASRSSDVLMATAVVGILVFMVIPLPTILLDLLLAFNITFALVILLVGMYILRPLELSAFPSILLLATLFRLSLNVASTRIILLNGHEGHLAAGKVIQSFGAFVVGGNYVVGIIVFFILVIINFLVITKGAGRIAEVAARFTLDAMPGKQLSIDADLNSGLINEDDARNRRQQINREADFYGAMDGASKLVLDTDTKLLRRLLFGETFSSYGWRGSLSHGVMLRDIFAETADELERLARLDAETAAKWDSNAKKLSESLRGFLASCGTNKTAQDSVALNFRKAIDASVDADAKKASAWIMTRLGEEAEKCLGEIGALQVCSVESGSAEIGPLEHYPREVQPGEIGTRQIIAALASLDYALSCPRHLFRLPAFRGRFLVPAQLGQCLAALLALEKPGDELFRIDSERSELGL